MFSKMRTVRKRRFSPFGRARIGAGIIPRFSKMLKAKPQNLAALRFFGRVARSQANRLNCQKQKEVSAV